jgi:hypothetical protein
MNRQQVPKGLAGKLCGRGLALIQPGAPTLPQSARVQRATVWRNRRQAVAVAGSGTRLGGE